MLLVIAMYFSPAGPNLFCRLLVSGAPFHPPSPLLPGTLLWWVKCHRNWHHTREAGKLDKNFLIKQHSIGKYQFFCSKYVWFDEFSSNPRQGCTGALSSWQTAPGLGHRFLEPGVLEVHDLHSGAVLWQIYSREAGAAGLVDISWSHGSGADL